MSFSQGLPNSILHIRYLHYKCIHDECTASGGERKMEEADQETKSLSFQSRWKGTGNKTQSHVGQKEINEAMSQDSPGAGMVLHEPEEGEGKRP